ncbi:MAG: beta-N-acetylhexosaminidase [Ferruginibacter sp.]
MKKTIFFLLFSASIVCTAQTAVQLVPMPVEVTTGKGDFLISANTTISISSDAAELKDLANYLQTEIKNKTGIYLQVSADRKTTNKKNNIAIELETGKTTPADKYELYISSKWSTIKAADKQSIFYGIQTLLQLIEQASIQQTTNNKQLSIRQMAVLDYPRFQYRGMHLDVCRHFFPVSFVKKYIDYLAAYKYNTFHWHLTDDQGWRIPIKKYPGLTNIGGWRNGTIIGRYPGKGSDNKYYGGFYTQEEIKEVVAYAAARYIEVIPEIEMPGHGSAAIAAYPWLSCFPQKPTEIPANMISKKSIEEQQKGRIKLVQETWGVFDDVFCAGKDSTFTFLENVIDEVISLFPSKYFHLGADECPKTHWKICAACQKRMKDNNLKDEHELQSWFVQRIEKYLNSKGKTMIGWDEILEGGLAPNAVVMSWRGEKGGIEAAKQKHQVIMTPGNPVYFDHTQSKNEDSVTIGGYNPIENVYAYEPISKELSAEEGKYILGAQANMWAEYMEYPAKVEYMMFPRMTALSEVLWSPREKRNWEDFERRLPAVYERLEKEKINYSKAYYDLQASVLPTADFNGIQWQLLSKFKDAKISYTAGIHAYALGYSGPIKIESSDKYAASLFSDGKEVSVVSQIFSFNKATGKKITIINPPSKSYPGNAAFTLVDGIQNEKGMSKSSEFLGFKGDDLDVTIDLGKDMDISKVTLHVLKQTGSWIYLPKQVEITYIPYIDTTIITRHPPLETITVDINTEDDINKIEIKKEKFCRYIQVRAKNYGIIPSGKPGGGNPAWLFVDEIEVD